MMKMLTLAIADLLKKIGEVLPQIWAVVALLMTVGGFIDGLNGKEGGPLIGAAKGFFGAVGLAILCIVIGVLVNIIVK